VVLGIEGEYPWRSDDDVVDVATTFRNDHTVDDVPALVFGEACIQHSTDDLLAVGADVVPLGFFPEPTRLLVEPSGVGIQLCGASSRASPRTTPACHGLRLSIHRAFRAGSELAPQ
jgi:hypothetical protein